MGSMESGFGSYSYIRSLEYNLMMSLGLSTEDYGEIDVMERATKVVAMNLSSWMDALESDKQMKMAEAKING